MAGDYWGKGTCLWRSKVIEVAPQVSPSYMSPKPTFIYLFDEELWTNFASS